LRVTRRGQYHPFHVNTKENPANPSGNATSPPLHLPELPFGRILEFEFNLQKELADDKKITVVAALKTRRDGLLKQKEQCDHMIAGQQTVARAAVDAKVGVEAAAAQQAGRAQVADETKCTFEDMAAKLGELQASVDAIFLEEKKLYAEEVEALGQTGGEATTLADGGHALWMGWKKAFDVEFSDLKTFVQLRHGQLVSYKSNYEYLRADRMPVSEKTDAPDGLNCYSPTEFQAQLDDIDSKIKHAEETGDGYGYPDPLPPIEKGLGIRKDLAGPMDTAIHDKLLEDHPEFEQTEKLDAALPKMMKKMAVPTAR
jgi:hypothetical protein